jgi:hypothetical protein
VQIKWSVTEIPDGAHSIFVAKDLGRNRSDDTGFSAAWQSRLRLDGPPAPRGIVAAARLTLL